MQKPTEEKKQKPNDPIDLKREIKELKDSVV